MMEENNPIENKEEMEEVEVWEFSLTEDEIDELRDKLGELKETKSKIEFGIDEKNELAIHYESEEEEN